MVLNNASVGVEQAIGEGSFSRDELASVDLTCDSTVYPVHITTAPDLQYTFVHVLYECYINEMRYNKRTASGVSE